MSPLRPTKHDYDLQIEFNLYTSGCRFSDGS